jgi:hypothetical protein
MDNGMNNIKKMAMVAVLLGAGGLAGSAFADTNVALDKSVTLTGLFGGIGGGGSLAPAQSLTDGNFASEGTLWNKGSVYWDTRKPGQANDSIEINLAATYAITHFTVQADNNDSYRVQYLNNGVWTTAWDMNTSSTHGLVTRDSGTLPVIETSKLRIIQIGGDQEFSVSEVQAFGAAVVPELNTTAMMAAGLGLLGFMVRRKRSGKF